jgi:hypothetical protein
MRRRAMRLAGRGVTSLDLPMTPQRGWSALNGVGWVSAGTGGRSMHERRSARNPTFGV